MQEPTFWSTQSTQTETLLTNSSKAQATQTRHFSTRDASTQTPGAQYAMRETAKPSPAKPLPDQSLGRPMDQPSVEDEKGDPSSLTVLTWNIDGLDVEDLRERVSKLLSYLRKVKSDVVLLQELIPPYLEILQQVLPDYEFLQGNTDGYFTGVLLRKSRVQLQQSSIVNFPTTEMSRNLLMAQLSFSGHQLCVMTSHLESCKTSSQERMNQLRRVWKKMRETSDDQTVIFGGDTNLRDWEVKKLGGLPEGISDVWEVLGEPENCRYTWDTVTNDNKEIPFPARLRFDRVYIRTAINGAKIKPESMRLVGLERLKCGRFTSDHWGILCTFSFESADTAN
ncbi:tyrosyl-DNA phosphodiesterase 2 isoform X1 [Denticeps clupeoides]|uniref:tyrosyl-DNA phosphodiesterase 2 isoform X1 n=1 Tax=Denticeps clupeoides TaxID=299321 RepID=UPI0010A2D334|nr:tyrosyl-DNA phosphodiesterase 2-like isoform X1 [Denticeps clupeoides]